MSAKVYIQKALRIVLEARLGRRDCNEALDDLWELLINADYEIDLMEAERVVDD